MEPARELRPRTCLVSLLVVVQVCAVARSARADSEASRTERAEALFREGVESARRGESGEACSRFRASLALNERASTLTKVGSCLRQEQKYVEAWRTLHRARDFNRNGPRRREDLESEIAGEIALIPTVRFEVSAVPGLEATLDGTDVPVTELGAARPVELGRHILVLEAPGFDRLERAFEVRDEGSQLFHLPPLTPRKPSPPPPPQRTVESAGPGKEPLAQRQLAPTPPNDVRAAAYIVGAVGVAGLGVAAVLGVMTLLRVNESNQYCAYPDGSCDTRGVSLRNQASDLQTAAIVTAVTSGAVVGTSVYLFVASDRSSRAERAGATLSRGLLVGGGSSW